MAGPDGTEVNHEPGIAVPDGTRSHKRVCGFRKTTFFLALALLLVVLAAIIGGAVGGTVSKRGASASSPQDAASTAIATLTVTAPSPTATGKQIRALSAANWARDTNSREIQVYTLYTDGSLIIRGFSQGVWSSSVPLPLSPVPRADSSIAAIATLAGPRLYYVSDSGSIAEAASESSNNCPGDIKACSWSFRTLTDTQVSGGGIAAVTGDFSNSLSGTHVYYFAPGGNLTEIVNFNGWGKPKVIFNNLRTANDVTVSAVAGQNGSEVFYFDGSLHWTHSSDGWSSAGAVGDQIEDKKLALAASYSGVPLDTRVYRVTNNGVLENYKDSSDFWDSSYPTGNGFTTTGDYSSSALNPVAATGWDKSSRIYRVKNGAVVEYILDSSQGWHNGTY